MFLSMQCAGWPRSHLSLGQEGTRRQMHLADESPTTLRDPCPKVIVHTSERVRSCMVFGFVATDTRHVDSEVAAQPGPGQGCRAYNSCGYRNKTPIGPAPDQLSQVHRWIAQDFGIRYP